VRAGIQESLGNDDSGSGSVRGRAALELGKGLVDHRGLHDLLKGVFILELGVGVALGVFVVDTSDLAKVFSLGSVPVKSVSLRL
jgi:hypothetical protein